MTAFPGENISYQTRVGYRRSSRGIGGTWVTQVERSIAEGAASAVIAAQLRGGGAGLIRGWCVDAQAAFGEKLRDVQQVEAASTSSSVESVDGHLDMLRPAIASYGASVEVGSKFVYGACAVSTEAVTHNKASARKSRTGLLREGRSCYVWESITGNVSPFARRCCRWRPVSAR
jgi:hypothetical protein